MKNNFLLRITLIAIFIFTNTLSTFCSDNGKDNAFALVESTPQNAAQNISVDAQIKLIFNKNVVNLTVKDNNSKCFSLFDSNNQTAPIEVIFPDDQIEPDKKREIYLKPKEPLKENTTYKVVISPELQAKNGSSLEKCISLAFTTITTTVQEAPSADIIEKDTETDSTSEASEKKVKEPEDTKAQSNTKSNALEVPEAKQVEKDISTESDASKIEQSVEPPAETEVIPSESTDVLQPEENIQAVSGNTDDNATVKNGYGFNIYHAAALLVLIVAALMIVSRINGKKRQP